jgi:hypothetical protein
MGEERVECDGSVSSEAGEGRRNKVVVKRGGDVRER